MPQRRIETLDIDVAGNLARKRIGLPACTDHMASDSRNGDYAEASVNDHWAAL